MQNTELSLSCHDDNHCSCRGDFANWSCPCGCHIPPPSSIHKLFPPCYEEDHVKCSEHVSDNGTTYICVCGCHLSQKITKPFSRDDLILIEEALSQRSVFESHEQSLDNDILRDEIRILLGKKPHDYLLSGDDDRRYIQQKTKERNHSNFIKASTIPYHHKELAVYLHPGDEISYIGKESSTLLYNQRTKTIRVTLRVIRIEEVPPPSYELPDMDAGENWRCL